MLDDPKNLKIDPKINLIRKKLKISGHFGKR
jgi:hypothetical protein